MASILLLAPATEPLTLADAKAFLRVEHADDDTLIGALITAARTHIEARTQRALITQQWRIVRDGWPPDGRLSVAVAPLRAVLAARVYDEAGVAHTIDVGAFVVDASAAPGVIGFVPWAVPAPGRAVAGIEIDVEAGYGDAPEDVPEPLRQAMRLLLAHWYENRASSGGSGKTYAAGIDALLAQYRALSL